MEFKELLNFLLYVVITVVLPVFSTFLINYIKVKIKESNIISNATKNENVSNIIKDALSSVMDAVLYVNQTYTDVLKKHGEFNETSQKEAFDKAYSAASDMISQESKNIICDLYGSFDQWLRLKIESSVNIAKRS